MTNKHHLASKRVMSFEQIVKGWLMPSVSLFGLVGNFLSIYILHHREVKLKKDFVDVLCMLATFDNLLLLSTFFLFSLPAMSDTWADQVGLRIKYIDDRVLTIFTIVRKSVVSPRV